MGGDVGAAADRLLRRMHAVGLELQLLLDELDDDPLAGPVSRAVVEVDLTVRELQGRALARAADPVPDA
ncbi:hypothetical protein [Jiangella alba]|uniref:Uncharacterized protein n=1 Tax=Jiangella alba TaxID=561176 RepID=A0A1H5IQT9_9ACTN|nr:hypothetical protein [Jiangella alba]SEE41868.1 hypothetical protein SAMN04488561_1263 [Jiangella alba]